MEISPSFSTISHFPRGQRSSHRAGTSQTCFDFYNFHFREHWNVKNCPCAGNLRAVMRFRLDKRKKFFLEKERMPRGVVESQPWCHLIPDKIHLQDPAAARGEITQSSLKNLFFSGLIWWVLCYLFDDKVHINTGNVQKKNTESVWNPRARIKEILTREKWLINDKIN